MALDVTVISKLSRIPLVLAAASRAFWGLKGSIGHGWIKAAAAQVRTTIREAANRVDRLGNSDAGRTPRPALDDPPGNKDHPEGKAPGADNR